jgi:hypothetical protein
VKARQFCSVCKQWLDMEVVPTGDADDDDGVIWFRCPRCQGFLPKLGGGEPASAGANEQAGPDAPVSADIPTGPDADLPWDSPADMMAARDAGERTDDVLRPRRGGGVPATDAPERARAAPDRDDETDSDELGEGERPDDAQAVAAAEPVAQYAAQLAAADPATAVPYRPSDSYALGQCVHHLAWDDCGVVVGKEALPGGRRVIKCYFAGAGVVRLIEEARE